MSNIDFLEEVHYDRFGREIVSASRGKRDTTSSGPDLVEEITNTRAIQIKIFKFAAKNCVQWIWMWFSAKDGSPENSFIIHLLNRDIWRGDRYMMSQCFLFNNKTAH